ncbi:DciA family protein [Nakamurella sp. A5-74]|uniref:DciA family protein n=1 Tax=Nakamurella sp. A5-74 TaxID=3158264 RepID=A0AAU8DPU5_9ACTN
MNTNGTGSGGTGDAGRGSGDDADPVVPRGADLAREALAAARAKNAANRKDRATLIQRNGGSARSLRRRRWSGSGADPRDPQTLGSALQKFVQASGAGADLVKAQLFARWAEIVGPGIADHCEPSQFVDRVVTVQCTSTAWAAQIRLMAPQVVRTINEALGHGTVTRVHAIGPTAPSWKFGPRHVSGRGPRDTYG